MSRNSVQRNQTRFALARIKVYVDRLAQGHLGLSEFDDRLAPLWAFLLEGIGTIDSVKLKLRILLKSNPADVLEQLMGCPDGINQQLIDCIFDRWTFRKGLKHGKQHCDMPPIEVASKLRELSQSIGCNEASLTAGAILLTVMNLANAITGETK